MAEGGQRVVRLQGRDRSEAGFTLIEMLITIFIVGTVVLAAATAMVTVQKVTGTTRERTRMELTLSAFVEAVKGEPFAPCTAGYSPAFTTPMNGVPVTPTMSSIEHWNGSAFGTPASCDPATDSAQRIAITLTHNGVTIHSDVVKRNPTAAP
jgi:prepilin-type N-terminal cleavage/methylation domain-containing protein